MAWIASVPDGSVLRFAAGGCYGQDGTVTVTDRRGLTIDGNGSTFRTLTDGSQHDHRANWRLLGGSDLVLRNMTARGANPQAGIRPEAYLPEKEGQHGFEVSAASNVLLEDLSAYDVYGDFVAVQWDRRYADDVAASPPARDVTIRRFRGERNGRQGLFVGHAEGVVMEASYMGDVRQNAVDIEPDIPENLARDITISGNTFGATRFSLLANLTGRAGNVGNITFTRNRMEAGGQTCHPAIAVESSPASPKQGFVVEDNELIQTSPQYWRALLDFAYVIDVTVRRNTTRLSRSGGCGGPVAGVSVRGSRAVTVTENAFNGADVAVQGSDGSEIHEWGNRL